MLLNVDDSKTASLLAKAVHQSILDCLTQHHREQAHSYSYRGVHNIYG